MKSNIATEGRPEEVAVCNLDPETGFPDWAFRCFTQPCLLKIQCQQRNNSYGKTSRSINKQQRKYNEACISVKSETVMTFTLIWNRVSKARQFLKLAFHFARKFQVSLSRFSTFLNSNRLKCYFFFACEI